MKYTHHITVDLPRDKVISLFDSQENMFKWQPGLKEITPISGVQGEEGAKMKLFYDMGKRKVEMIETILKKDLPDEFTGSYEATGVYNIVKNTFEADGEKTKWTVENEFQFSNLMMKIMGFLMPGAFKRQSFKFMELFKNFAESEEESE